MDFSAFSIYRKFIISKQFFVIKRRLKGEEFMSDKIYTVDDKVQILWLSTFYERRESCLQIVLIIISLVLFRQDPLHKSVFGDGISNCKGRIIINSIIFRTFFIIFCTYLVFGLECENNIHINRKKKLSFQRDGLRA